MNSVAKTITAAALLCFLSTAASAEILIATIGPLKGQYAALGEQLRRGAAQAVADINAAGGANSEQLVLDVVDDGSVYGAGLAIMFKAALNGAGVTETARESYKPGVNDYNDLIQKLLTANASRLSQSNGSARIRNNA